MSNNIVWQPVKKDLGRMNGYVGNLKSFFIGEIYSLGQKEMTFFLTSDRFEIKYTNFPTLEAAKAAAEARLAAFLHDTGLVFKRGVTLKDLTLVDAKYSVNDGEHDVCEGCYFHDLQDDVNCSHPHLDVSTPEQLGCDEVIGEGPQQVINHRIFVPVKEVSIA